MGNRKSSWRKRRWELFLQQYQASSELREALKDKRLVTPIGGEVKPIHYRILARHGVPASCILAIQLYLRNPNLNESEYLKLIYPPIRFLNAVSNIIGPDVWGTTSAMKNDSAYRPDDATEFLQRQLGKKLIGELNLKPEDIEKIGRRIFGGNTVLFISPYTQKYEVVDFLDDYWNKQLKPLVNRSHPDMEDLPPSVQHALTEMQEEKLAKKIYPAKTSTNWKRDKYIMELHAKGYKDSEIVDALSKHAEFKDFDILDTNTIKQIRFRMRKKQK